MILIGLLIAVKDGFSVLQFNLLAQSLTSPDDFICSPPESLLWENRKHALLHELLRHRMLVKTELLCVSDINFSISNGSALDVLCLQECDEVA